jgi:CHASE3 domain sensor protein
MMFKFVLLVILLFLTYGVVVWLLKRLTDTSQQIAELHSQMRRNDEILAAKIAAMEEQKRALDAQKAQQGETPQ